MSYFKIVQNVDDKKYVVISTNGVRSFEVASFDSLVDAQSFMEYQSCEKKNISVYLPEMIISAMDNECKEKHVKRSDIVRECLEGRYNFKGLF